MFELLLIVVIVWVCLALLALPLAMRVGRLASRADADAERQHETLRVAF